MNAILIAHDGLLERICAEKGVKSKQTTKARTVTVGGNTPRLTPQNFDAVFKSNPRPKIGPAPARPPQVRVGTVPKGKR